MVDSKQLIQSIKGRPLMFVTKYNFDCVVNYVSSFLYFRCSNNLMNSYDMALREKLQDYTYRWVCKNINADEPENLWFIMMKKYTKSDYDALKLYYAITESIFDSVDNITKESNEGFAGIELNQKIEDSIIARKYEILGDKVQTEEEILHRLYSCFQFPEEYSETWKDMEEGLIDLSWTGHNHWELIVWRADKLLINEPEVKERFLHLIKNIVIPYWKEKDRYDFKLSLKESDSE